MKEAREALGLSQVVLAARCGISSQAQLNFEKDRNLPGAAYLLALDGIGVDAGQVLTGKPSAMSQVEQELLMRFRVSTPQVQGAVFKLLGLGSSNALTSAPISFGGDNHGQVISGTVVQDNVTFNVGTKKRAKKK